MSDNRQIAMEIDIAFGPDINNPARGRLLIDAIEAALDEAEARGMAGRFASPGYYIPENALREIVAGDDRELADFYDFAIRVAGSALLAIDGPPE